MAGPDEQRAARARQETEERVRRETAAGAKAPPPPPRAPLPPPQAAEPPAQLTPKTIGRYVVGGLLGEGGMGRVVRATDPTLGRDVAIKLLLDGAWSTERAKVRFQREARAVARLRHPAIVQVFDAGVHEAAPYLVLEYVAGCSLEALLDRDGALPPGDAARILGKIARALHHAHEVGILHRDLKPANILVRHEDGEPLLTDFGLATGEATDGGTTTRGLFVGTPGFCAPEQIQHAAMADVRSDVFGLAATLYAALVGGGAPFLGESLGQIVAATLAGRYIPPSSVHREIPPAFDAVIRRALALDPDQRPQTAAALAAELERLARPRESALVRAAALDPPSSDKGTPLDPVGVLDAIMAEELEEPAPDPTREAWSASTRLTRGRQSEAPVPEAVEVDGGATLDPQDAFMALLAALARTREAQAANDLTSAREAAERALALGAERPEPWIERAEVRRRQGDEPGALQDLGEALRRAPDDARALARRGWIKLRRRDHRGAVEDLERAARALPPGSKRLARVAGALERARQRLAGQSTGVRLVAPPKRQK
jgi:serine/threonine protein kinase